MKRTNFINKNISEQSGITLVALVVTIIILLILAGITVASLTGNNGLIGKSGEAKNATEEAAIKEDLEINVLASYKKANINYDLLNSKLSNINGLKYKNNSISDTNKITKLPDWVDIKGYKFDILEDGTIEKRPDYEKLRSMYGTVLNGYNAGKDLDETKKVDSWRLFYVDEENGDAFFISSNALPAPQPTANGIPILSKYSGSNNVKNFEYGKKYNGLWLEKCVEESTNSNAKATAYMCDPNNWDCYKLENAKYSAGGPTIEILTASIYNKQIKDFKSSEYVGNGSTIREVTKTGYTNVNNLSLTSNSLYNIGKTYSISSPCNTANSFMLLAKTSWVHVGAYSYASDVCLRPIVCFKASNIKIDGGNLSV